ncbi:MAG: tRNA (guanine37-N1)-methyltransferase [Thermosediminibacterales bacterium]|nr:tRNA (guanine37-N1)-methyltransferase [Thermosediminibacterales bacterium]MDK2835889.1 tRNA (guanine37-N1)-methyltransferase [Thermosediminibacterales bacterium]
MIIDILTLFPEMFKGPFEESIIKKAVNRKLIKINIINIRDFSKDKHKKVDDYPYGGGAGMLLKPEPVFDAVDAITSKIKDLSKTRIILMTPQGNLLNQKKVKEISKYEHLIIICGHYEGFDERIRFLVDEEISIGDYITTGGELPAMVLTDAVVRLIPGVIGGENSLNEESFENGLLEYPQYTRPEVYRNLKVPDVLLSGNHEEIKKWRHKESLKRTLIRRPDMLEKLRLSEDDKKYIKKLAIENKLNASD